ncbi:MAG: hypothetical protein IKP27_10395 [Paludibacteraceae bacterium]|nr:hypothetical protein [Paludibacteraceae bacterium]
MNKSSHPYKLEYKTPNGLTSTIQTIPARGQYEITEEDAGVYDFKSTQKSGYLLYPTVEKKSIRIEAGQTKTVNIGYDHN